MNIQKDILLAPYTTLHVGGVTDYLVAVETEDELVAALQWAHAHTATPPLILGGGSNVLINDDGYRGLVVINKIAHITYKPAADQVRVQVGAGVVLDDFIADTVERGYWGLENLSAIPGTVGATPIQNVGAYGVEVASVITSVHAVHTITTEKKVFTHSECEFEYRDSFFKSEAGSVWCVTAVEFRLSSVARPQLSYADMADLVEKEVSQKTIRENVIAIRSKKFPDWHTVGTAGSFFKNPLITPEHFAQLQTMYAGMPGYTQPDGRVKVSLGWILDKVCNLKGYREAAVRLYEAQALVLVAERGATAYEIDVFAEKIAEKVFEKTKIKIEREVKKFF